MILKACKSKNYTFYYIQKSFRSDNGKVTTKNVEKLGTYEDLIDRFGDKDPISAAKAYAKELTEKDKESKKKINISLDPALLISKENQRTYNGGYLFLQKIYYELGLDYICGKIEKKHRNSYNLNEILSMLLYTRLLYPGSKLSSLEDAAKFLEQPESRIHQVYRALSVLAEESDNIQADVYRRSLKLGRRDTGVVYYDLTNYFFDWEQEGGLVQYGHSKEGRPLPIVQMGLFMDRDGFPLAMCIEPWNTAETTTLKPMEEKLRDKFGLSKIVVCTDGDLSSYENRKRDDRIKAHFLTCFLALLIYKYLERKVNRGGRHFSTDEIVSTLRDMNFLHIEGEGYIPTYTRTDLTNNLHGSAGFRTDTQIVPKKTMRTIISQTKKRTPDKDE